MNIFEISGLFIGILCSILGALTFVKGNKNLHYIWALFSFSVAIWGFGSYEIASSSSAVSAIFWWRIAYIGVIFIPILFAHFSSEFLNIKRRIFTFSIYFLGISFLILDLFNGLFISRVRFSFSQFYYLSSPSIIYDVFVTFFIALILYSYFNLWKGYKKRNGSERTQIRYFFIATIPGFLSGAFEFLPVYKINIYPYFHSIIILSPLIVTYAILRYRFMDIRVVVRKTFIYFMSAAFAYGIFYLLIWFYNNFFGGVFQTASYISGLFVAVVFVPLFLWFYEIIQKIGNRYFFFSQYNYQKTINDLSEKLNYINDLDKLVDLIIDTVKQAMQLDKVGIMLTEFKDSKVYYKTIKAVGFEKNNNFYFIQNDFLARYLLEKQKPLIREEIQPPEKKLFNENYIKNIIDLTAEMKESDISLYLPLMSSKKLIGIIILGSKISKDAYTKEDLELLSTLAYQAGIAVDNAILYKEIQDFNKTLQQKVDEQTKDIKEAYEVEKQAHEELKNLDDAKTQFMLITQHHLRTPLSSTMGYMDLLLNNTFGKIPAKIKGVLLRVQESTLKEIDVVNDLLNVSQFQLGKEVMRLDPGVNMESLLQETIKDLRVEAENKGIYLKIEKTGNVPTISADKIKLKLALTNVIDNAVKYTAQGGVTITLKSEDKKLLILIKDTGMGISKDSIPNLFNQTFHRGEEAQKIFAVGKGIGLFLSGKIIEGHKGKIWAESEGEGKGSVFYIELPII